MAGSWRLPEDTLSDCAYLLSITAAHLGGSSSMLLLASLNTWLSRPLLQPAISLLSRLPAPAPCSLDDHNSCTGRHSSPTHHLLLSTAAEKHRHQHPASAWHTDMMDTRKLFCQDPHKQGVVLFSCGSFNPPTVMHMRMFELAADAVPQAGLQVWGGYLSPVGDAYGKPGLAPSAQRVAMCEAAAADHPFVVCDAWEASQPQYTRTLGVLRHVKEQLDTWWAAGGRPRLASSQQQPSTVPDGPGTPIPGLPAESEASRAACVRPPRVMLLCGADVLLSMVIPGIWEHPEQLLEEFGVVCVERNTGNRAAQHSIQASQGAAPGGVQHSGSQQSMDEPIGLQLANLQQQRTNGPAGGAAEDQGEQGCKGGQPTHVLSALQEAMQQQDGLLSKYQQHIHIVVDPVPNSISSTVVRQEWAERRSVRYLVPDKVLSVMQQAGPCLYSA